MNKIEVDILNPAAIPDILDTMVLAARLTQHGHEIHNFDDLADLYSAPYTGKLVKNLCALPHPTLQKLGVINIAVVGASRRFLAQITRHQHEVKFISASLQYSDYSDNAAFAVPYGILKEGSYAVDTYLESCRDSLRAYEEGRAQGIDNDSLGYLMPQGLRNVLIISAAPYQWKYMIHQRICRRNTDETRIVMLKIWDLLAHRLPEVFTLETTGAFCMQDICKEGRMSCKNPISPVMTPEQILKQDYPLLFEEENNEDKSY